MHGSSPVTTAVEAAVLRFAANGGGVHDDFSTHQSHATSTFREPLIPADSNTQLAVLGLPDLEAGITGVEVELLLITRTIGNVGLSVDSEDSTIGINNGNGVVVSLVVLFEERDREDNIKFLSYFLEVSNELRGSSRLSKSKGSLLLILHVKIHKLNILGRNTNQQRALGGE